MSEPSKLPPLKKQFFDLDPKGVSPDLYRPPTLMRTTEWGGLTMLSLLLASLFPPYFIQVLVIAFFNAGGLYWVTHLSEKGRQRLVDFEREFRQGYALEEAHDYQAAQQYYAALASRYQDVPTVAEVATRRIDYLKDLAAKAPAPKKPAPKKPAKKIAKRPPARKRAK
jgi:hypothetical protein